MESNQMDFLRRMYLFRVGIICCKASDNIAPVSPGSAAAPGSIHSRQAQELSMKRSKTQSPLKGHNLFA
jgi:hypothetical protein